MNKLDMRMIRSFINGEIPGARKMLFFILVAFSVWITGMYYSSNSARMEQAYGIQHGRLITLNELAVQYKQLIGNRSVNVKTAEEDLITVFSQIVEEAGMRDRLLQISPVSRGASVQMDGLYAEDIITILKEISKYGIRVSSSELRAMPFQDKRLFLFSAVLEVEE